ncbi:hypothetical protein NFI96_024374 [Prochilodus magdalenae]|nr:hypothetical protein NFI96_024374 [Prochilodus magdalenae]
MMASSRSSLEQDLSCPVCFEIFTDPVILSCSHSFCGTCLQMSWEQSLGRDCPVCRRRAARDDVQINLALRNACESYMQQARERESDPQRCSLHSQKLSLFCVDDEKLVCPICVSQDHQNHSFCSINKAASPRKEKLKIHLTNLEQNLKTFQTVKNLSDQEAAHIKFQAQNTEKQIKEEFEKLHKFLRKEEEDAIAALRKEEDEKSQRMKKTIEELNKQIMEISSRVRELNVMLGHDALIVKDFKKANERAQYTVPDPELQSGALIDVAKHLGNLSHRVWKRMKILCPYFPVVLDPNTANPSLSISADLSSFSHSAEKLQLPDNLERMSAYAGVLGSGGFSSGTHSWEVEVENTEDWIVGVAEESVFRKVNCETVPENGFCCLWRDVGIVADASGAFRSSEVEALDKQKLLAVMATSLLPLEQDLSCPVCFEIFNDPVILSCSHSFCRTCLQRSWEQSLGKDCPVCRHQASTDDLQTNLILRNACESYMKQKRERESDPQRCPLHSQKLQMFCVDDEKLVCGQCVIQDHQNHSFCSINKAAGPRKEKLKTHLRNLEAKLKTFKTVKDINVQEAAHIESQAQDTEKQIQEEFEKLHQFLREEEEATIAALQKEEVEKSQKIMKTIEELDKHIMEIGSRVRELEVMLENDVLVLQVRAFRAQIKANVTKILYGHFDVILLLQFRNSCPCVTRARYIVPDPELESGVLIDVAKHLGNLSYRVWEKMVKLCPYFPVVLDPNTANPTLSISADLSNVSRFVKNCQLPDNPERMSGYRGVLGSEGFSSGTHSWEVEVGCNVDWIVGVAEESVNRKKLCGAVPENGFCCIWRDGDEIKAAVSMSATETLMTSSTLKKIRVTLQLEKGLVTFTNPASNTDLYTFTRSFTKKVYPYFRNGTWMSLKVLPSRDGRKEAPAQSTAYSFLTRSKNVQRCSCPSFHFGIVAYASGVFRSSEESLISDVLITPPLVPVEALDRQKLLAVMATSLLPLEQDLSCPVCFEIFNDPVILSCSHSFCRTCLQRSWEQSLGRDCPVCRHRAATDDLQTNLVLRNACESYMKQKRERESDPQRCPLHSQKLSLFCVDDEKLVCGQCVIQDHQNHSFCSINKAAGPCKEQLKIPLANLEQNLKTFQTVKNLSDQEAAHIKCQAQNTEKQIKEEFEKLHKFLREEEEVAIAILRVEEDEKSHRMKKKIEELNKQIMEISSRVRELNIILENDELILKVILISGGQKKGKQ